MHLIVTATILLLVSTTVLVFGRPQDSEKKIEPVVAEVKLELVPRATDDTKEPSKSSEDTGKVSSGEAIKEETPIDDTKSVVADVADETTTKENTTTTGHEEEKKKEIVVIEMEVATTPAVVVVASDASKEPIVESSGESPLQQHETIPIQNAETVDNAAAPTAKEEVAVAEKVDDATPAAKEEVAVAEKVDDATPAAKEEVTVAENSTATPIEKEEVAVAEKVDDAAQPPVAPVIPKTAVEQEPSPFAAMWRPYRFECAKESDDFAGEQCADWAMAGYCETNKATKFLFCRKTCLCEGPPKHLLT